MKISRNLLISLGIFLISTVLQGQLLHSKYLHLNDANGPERELSSKERITKHKDVPELTISIFDSYEYDDLEVLGIAPQLYSLSIIKDNLDLSAITQLEQLQQLLVEAKGLKNLKSIEQLKSLKELKLNTDLPLDFNLHLDSLSKLTYTCNFNLKKCTFPNLKSIDIHQAVDYDLDYDNERYGIDYALAEPLYAINLNKFKALTDVYVRELLLTDINQLNLPENTEHVHIYYCRHLLELSGLEDLKKLKSLSIAFCNNIQNFEFLKKLEHIEWTVVYMGKEYTKENLHQLLTHPKGKYYYADDEKCTEQEIKNGDCSTPPEAFYRIQAIHRELHQKVISQPLSRQEFLELLPPIMEEFYEIDYETLHGGNDNYGQRVEELDFEIIDSFLIELGHLAGHDFDNNHVIKWLYKLYQ